jgi:hypothetical protein
VSVLKLSNVSFRGKCARMGNTLQKLPSPTKLARLGHFPPASQAGRLAGPVFYVYVFSLVFTEGGRAELKPKSNEGAMSLGLFQTSFDDWQARLPVPFCPHASHPHSREMKHDGAVHEQRIADMETVYTMFRALYKVFRIVTWHFFVKRDPYKNEGSAKRASIWI